MLRNQTSKTCWSLPQLKPGHARQIDLKYYPQITETPKNRQSLSVVFWHMLTPICYCLHVCGSTEFCTPLLVSWVSYHCLITYLALSGIRGCLSQMVWLVVWLLVGQWGAWAKCFSSSIVWGKFFKMPKLAQIIF